MTRLVALHPRYLRKIPLIHVSHARFYLSTANSIAAIISVPCLPLISFKYNMQASGDLKETEIMQ